MRRATPFDRVGGLSDQKSRHGGLLTVGEAMPCSDRVRFPLAWSPCPGDGGWRASNSTRAGRRGTTQGAPAGREWLGAATAKVPRLGPGGQP